MKDVRHEKRMSPYGKSTSCGFELLSSKDGLSWYGGYFRLVFGLSIVFWIHRGLTKPFFYQETRT